MNQIKKWAIKKPYIIAITAPQIASSSDACFEAFKSLKIDERHDYYPALPKSNEWIDLYKSHRKIEGKLIEIYRDFNEITEIGVEFFKLFSISRKTRRTLGSKRFNKKIKVHLENITPDEWKDIGDLWNEFFQVCMNNLEAEFSGEIDKELAEKFKAALLIPEMAYFLRVWTPCWLLYKELPPYLLRRARNGDLDALEKILRLDSAVLNDPKISEIFHQSCWTKNKSTFDLITKSLQSGLKSKITPQKIKMNFAGLISAIAFLIRFKLNEPDIRNLFDSVSNDSGKGPIDIDLPESPEAFAKAIQRERKFWLKSVKAWTKNSS